MCIIGNTILLFPIIGLELFNMASHDLEENTDLDLEENKKLFLLIILFSNKTVTPEFSLPTSQKKW